MSKRKDKQKRAQTSGKVPEPESSNAAAGASSAPRSATDYTRIPGLRRAPGWLLGACFAAYAAWLGVMVWLALQPKSVEPLPARLVTGSPLIVVGRAGPEGLTVTEVLKGTIPPGATMIPLTEPPGQPDAADRIHFLRTATHPPDVVRYAPFDPAIPSAPAAPLLLTQVRDILRAEAQRPALK